MDKFKEIRPVVLGIVKKNNKILVSKGYDKVEKQYFYRCIGGGIEFLENSIDALKREFFEELGINIEILDFLGIIENIFTYQGKKAHEIILLYNISINDDDIKDTYHIIDDNSESNAYWINIEDVKNSIIYPNDILKYL